MVGISDVNIVSVKCDDQTTENCEYAKVGESVRECFFLLFLLHVEGKAGPTAAFEFDSGQDSTNFGAEGSLRAHWSLLNSARQKHLWERCELLAHQQWGDSQAAAPFGY